MSKIRTGKMLLASLTLVTVLALTGFGLAGTVNFTLPYLHSNNGLTTYCMVSNMNPSTSTDNTTSDTTATFKVMATEKGAPAQTVHTIPTEFTPKSGTMRMFVFRQNAIYNGSGTKILSFSDEISTDDGNYRSGGNNMQAYSGMLSVTSSTATCQTITMACMQSNYGDGYGAGKRFAGYTCSDGTNLLAY
ncbi:MAG: hypothetical protein H7843_04730 [Nitrospirota bacterium]